MSENPLTVRANNEPRRPRGGRALGRLQPAGAAAAEPMRRCAAAAAARVQLLLLPVAAGASEPRCAHFGANATAGTFGGLVPRHCRHCPRAPSARCQGCCRGADCAACMGSGAEAISPCSAGVACPALGGPQCAAHPPPWWGGAGVDCSSCCGAAWARRPAASAAPRAAHTGSVAKPASRTARPRWAEGKIHRAAAARRALSRRPGA